jgi:hypothetical protein
VRIGQDDRRDQFYGIEGRIGHQHVGDAHVVRRWLHQIRGMRVPQANNVDLKVLAGPVLTHGVGMRRVEGKAKLAVLGAGTRSARTYNGDTVPDKSLADENATNCLVVIVAGPIDKEGRFLPYEHRDGSGN